MKEIVLSISVLLSDRHETIRRCLDSLEPLRREVNSELILVVTTDDVRVHRLAEEYAEQIVTFEWCNDFSKARNAGLERAKGEWFLYLDDDEWFEDCEELIRFFRSGEYHRYVFANYIQRNFRDRELHYYTDTPVTRMIRRRPEIRFRSKIHEYFYPVDGTYKTIQAIANHTGYIGTDEQTLRQRFRRNAPLLLEMLEREPESLRWQIQLLQEYRSVELWAWEYTFARRCMEEYQNRTSNDEEARAAFIGAIVEGLTELRRYDEALEQIGKGLDSFTSPCLTRAFLYLEAAQNYLRRREPEASESSVLAYFQTCEKLKKNRNAWVEDSAKIIVGDAAEEMNYIKAESIRICCELLKGNASYFEEHLDSLRWDRPAIYLLDDLIPIWVEVMSQAEDENIFSNALNLAWKNNSIRECLLKELQKKENEKTLQIVANLHCEHWYISYAQVLMMIADGKQLEDVRPVIGRYFQLCENVFRIPDDLQKAAERYDLHWREFYDMVPFPKWCRDLEEFINESGSELSSVDVEGLYEYIASAGIAYTRQLYSEKAIQEASELLPAECRAALRLEGRFQKEDVRDESVLDTEEIKQRIACVKAVLREWPQTAPLAKAYLHKLAEPAQGKNSQKQQDEEMRRISAGILEQVYTLINGGYLEEAEQIIHQLEGMMPDDDAVNEARKQLEIRRQR